MTGIQTTARSVALLGYVAVAVLLASCATGPNFQDQADHTLDRWAAQHDGIIIVRSLSELPSGVRDHFGEIADRGQRFNPGCVWRKGVPGKRFLAAAHNQDIWRVVVESGGVVHGLCVTEFRLNEVGQTIKTEEPVE